jgi:hypothetical protein
VHFSEISKIEKEILGYSTYEITSSSIHCTNSPGSPYIFPNYRRIAGASARNFILVDAVSEGTGAQMQVTCNGANGNNYFNFNFVV